MKRVLLFGASGQVGRALIQLANRDIELAAPTSRDVDFTNDAALVRVMRDVRPDVVINCAAFTRVDDAEAEQSAAIAINAHAPGVLSALSAASGARFVHVSTDYVFSGVGNPPFSVKAPTHPLNKYGSSKLEGESAVLAANPRAAVVRTAWVHSGSGVNFVATAVRVLRNGVMRVVDDQVSTPTRAASLARAIWILTTDERIEGLLHFTDAGVASWYDVASCVLETMRAAGAASVNASVLPVNSSAFPRPAARPRVSLLDKHDSWLALNYTPAHWRDGVIASTLELLNA